MNTHNKALREIEETMVLVEYLIYHNLDFDDIRNFATKTVKQAVEWSRDSEPISALWVN